MLGFSTVSRRQSRRDARPHAPPEHHHGTIHGEIPDQPAPNPALEWECGIGSSMISALKHAWGQRDTDMWACPRGRDMVFCSASGLENLLSSFFFSSSSSSRGNAAVVVVMVIVVILLCREQALQLGFSTVLWRRRDAIPCALYACRASVATKKALISQGSACFFCDSKIAQ
uniref:Uncharacterized protein n=1 Tax=Leersia perrieri TaxID=77586 RepID=A0A0D9WGZ6_9ORYZ